MKRRYGGNMKLPDLRVEIARRPKIGSTSDGCAVYFVGWRQARNPNLNFSLNSPRGEPQEAKETA